MTTLALDQERPAHARRSLALYLAAFVLALAPTLPLMQFFRTPENLVIGTALEMRRDGHWLLPTLEGEPRTVKPPLATWITALSIQPATVSAMSSPVAAERESAFNWLAWEARWPWLVAACGVLLATFELGRTIGGLRLALPSALVCGSAYLFIRFAPAATTDLCLTLFVAVANVFLAKAVLQDRRWVGCLGAGVAIGLALMSKGPPALVQSVVPVAAFALWRWWVGDRLGAPWRLWLGPMAAGVGVMLLIALPWPVGILLRDPNGQLARWLKEMTGQDDPSRADPWPSYLLLLPYIFPWCIFFVIGIWRLCTALRSRTADRASGMILALFLLIIPLLIMTLFKDRKDRYMLPMVPAAAVLTAGAVMKSRKQQDDSSSEKGTTLCVALHWGALAVAALGLPLVGATTVLLSSADGMPWYPWPMALLAAGVAGSLIVISVRRSRIAGFDLVAGTFAVMLFLQFVFMYGYSKDAGGCSSLKPLAERILARYPNAEMLNGMAIHQRASEDLSIYMNRPTRWCPPDQLAKLQPADRPRVAVLLQRPKNPDPQLPGWSQFASVVEGRNRWWAFVLDPKE